MKLEFCLKCGKEHLAVNMMPLSVTIHSLENVSGDIFSLTCRFLSLASEIAAVNAKAVSAFHFPCTETSKRLGYSIKVVKVHLNTVKASGHIIPFDSI